MILLYDMSSDFNFLTAVTGFYFVFLRRYGMTEKTFQRLVQEGLIPSPNRDEKGEVFFTRAEMNALISRLWKLRAQGHI